MKDKQEGKAPATTVEGRAAPPTKERRWTARRKREAVLRLLKGESLDAVARDLGVELHKLEQWREKALAAMEAGLTVREDDPKEAELDEAFKRVGELTMEVELLRERIRKQGPFPRMRWRS
jgi:hypothetical protein